MALTKITSRILDSSGVTILGTIATGVWQGTPINQTYLVGQSGTNTGDETLARINALNVTELGTISSGVWNGTVIASAYLDADTAHLSTTQTFTGAKSFSSNVGIGVAAHGTASLNITNSNQHIRLNNGSELGIINLDSDGKLDLWAHGEGETISFRTGTGSGTVAMSVVGTNVGIGTGATLSKRLNVYDSSTSKTAQQVISDGGSTSKLYLGTFSNNAYLSQGGTYSSGWASDGTNAIANIVMSATDGNSQISFQTSTTNNVGPTDRLTISSGGTVSIGSSTATNPLSIRTANGESYLRFLNANGTSYGDLERSITGNGAVRITTPYFRVTGTLETQLIQSALGIVFDNNSVSGNKTNVTLNDYEEGTWTPTNQGTSNMTTAPSSFSGTYTRIGNRVTCDFKMSGLTAPYTGALIYIDLGGFPFPQNPTTSISNGTCINYPNGRQTGGVRDGGSAYADVFQVFWQNTASTQSNATVIGTITYQV